jgi:glyoxylase-like metal-dependent hydrolase (beta-lactamase superfamily II)
MADEVEVYAIRYSSREAQAEEHFYRNPPCHGDMPMAYYIWLIKTPHGAVVLDTGYTRAKAERLGREFVAEPFDTMRELGVEVADVSHLLLSHLHFDHTGRIGELADAEIVIQRREMEFWLGPQVHLGEYPALCDPDDLSALVRANVEGRVRWVDGVAEIVPGVTVHLVGGHTPGSQVVRVETGAGPVVLMADASHFYANYEQRSPYAIAHTLPLMYEAFSTIQELAGPGDIVVPGHDPLVMERHPAPRPELVGRVARLA